MFKVQAIAISVWLIWYLNDINVIVYLPRFLKTLPPNDLFRQTVRSFGQNSQYRNYERNYSFSFFFFLLFFPFKEVLGCKKPALCPVFTQMANNSTSLVFKNWLDINVCCLLLIWRFSRWKRYRTAYRTTGLLMEFEWELQQQSSLTFIDRGFIKINLQHIRFCSDGLKSLY